MRKLSITNLPKHEVYVNTKINTGKHFWGNTEPSVYLVYSKLLQVLISDLKYVFARPVSLLTMLPDKAVENLPVVRRDFYELPKNKRKMQTFLIFVQVISDLEFARRVNRNGSFLFKDTAN